MNTPLEANRNHDWPTDGNKGKRGAKRKPEALVKRQIGIKLPGWIIDFLDTLPLSRAVTIESLICDKYKLTPLGDEHDDKNP